MVSPGPYATGFALLIDVTVIADPQAIRTTGWTAGPVVITYGDYAGGPDIATTAVNRAGQFSPRAAQALYGSDGVAEQEGLPHRYHRWLTEPLDLASRGAPGTRIVGLELIVARRFPSLPDRLSMASLGSPLVARWKSPPCAGWFSGGAPPFGGSCGRSHRR